MPSQLSRGLTLLALLAAAALGASSPREFRDLARPAIRSYSQRDGLPHHTVHQLVLDPLGRIWAATQGGAAVFDGRRWTPVVPPADLGNPFVRTLAAWQGAMWMGTQDSGVFRWRDGVWRHFDAKDGLPALRVNQLVEVPRPEGGTDLWAATAEGPARLDGDRWIREDQGLGNRWTWRLAHLPGPSGEGELWACTRGGLARRSGHRWVIVPEFAGQEVNHLVADAQAPRSVRWVSGFGRGLARWEGDRITYPWKAANLPLERPASLAWTQDPAGHPVLWVGTYNEGLATYREGKWSLLTPERGLRSLGVYALLPDPRGKPALWMGMLGGGVSSLTPEGWSSLLAHQTGLPSPDVACFAETAEREGSRIWFGTSKGLAWFDGRTWHQEGPAQGVPRAGVLALARTSAEGLVAATEAGWSLRTGGRWRPLPSRPPGELQALLGTRDGDLWAATDRGLFRRQGVTWTEATPMDRGRVDILCLAETLDGEGRGTLWAGSRGQGLWRLRDGLWERMDPMPRYPASWITALHASRNARGPTRLWVGTRGQGIAALDPSSATPAFQVFDDKGPVGIPNTVVFALEEDRAGRLYLGASGGVERLTFAPGTLQLQSVETFGPADGLLAAIANPGASLVDHLGRVWFGMPEGPAFLDPEEASPQRPLPAPVLERLQVEGQEAPLQPERRYPHRTHRMSFDFFVPAYFREEDLRFRTQLVGLEPEPGPWRFENVRDYGGLRPGRYDLRVWARDSRGTVSPPLHHPFVIQHSPWTHPLSWALYGVLLAGAAFLALRLRTRFLEQRNRWLLNRVEAATEELREHQHSLQMLTDHLYRLNEEKSLFMGMAAHDLRNPLQGIRLKAELLALNPDPASQLVSQDICGAVDEVTRLLNRLLDVEAIETGRRDFRMEPVSARRILAQIRDHHRARAEAKEIEVLLEVPEEDLHVQADAETLMEILDNLLSNALKFSPPGRRVWVGASATEAEGALWVRDEGPGFSEEDKAKAFHRFARLSARPTAGESSTGLGLVIVKRLAEDMKGRIDLESAPGAGATFRIVLPLA